jgi:hypothetical protein
MQWGFPQRREAIAAYAQEQHTDAEALYDRKVLEEAYCRYGTYRKKLQEQENYDLDTDRQFTENERELLRTLDRTDAGQREAAIAPAIAAMDLESNLDADQVLGEEIVETSKDKRISVPDMLNTAERSTEEIQRFLKAFPEQGVWLNQPLQEIIRFSDKTKEMYSTRKRDGEEFDPDNDLGFQAMLKHANDKIENSTVQATTSRRNPTAGETGGNSSRAIFSGSRSWTTSRWQRKPRKTFSVYGSAAAKTRARKWGACSPSGSATKYRT